MRWFGWFRKPEVLTPGICECDHKRCSHVDGKGRCTVAFPPGPEFPNAAYLICACQIFILDEDDNGGSDSVPPPVDPELAELKRMSRL